MKRLLAIALLAMSIGAQASVFHITINEYRAMSIGQRTGYIIGMVNASEHRYCLPSYVTAGQVDAVLMKSFTDRPDIWHVDVETGVLLAFARAGWVCK